MALLKRADPPSREELMRLLAYDPETGLFRWKVSRGKNGKAGTVAGTPTGKHKQYIAIQVEGRPRLAHRLAWLYMTGEWPELQVDHRNGVASDNRWGNLRLATQTQQNMNAVTKKKVGLKGCTFTKGAWQTWIQVDGVRVNLGRHATEEEAHRVYMDACSKMHGDYFLKSRG